MNRTICLFAICLAVLMTVVSCGNSTPSPPVNGNDSNASASSPMRYILAGSVTNSSGTGVQGVMISLQTGATTTTDSSGIYSFANLPSGSYTVTPRKGAYVFDPANISVTVKNANVTGISFSADGTGDLTGVVSLENGNGPLSGVTIYSGAKIQDGLSDPIVSTETGSNGAFALHSFAAGYYAVLPVKEGFSFSPTALYIDIPDYTAVYFFAAPITFRISGSVTSRPAADPSAITYHFGKTVTVENTVHYAVVYSSATDSKGHFEIAGVPIGTYRIKNPSGPASCVSGCDTQFVDVSDSDKVVNFDVLY